MAAGGVTVEMSCPAHRLRIQPLDLRRVDASLLMAALNVVSTSPPRLGQGIAFRGNGCVPHSNAPIHRRCASGLSVAYEQIVAQSEAEAIADADTRFVSLIASRAGAATLGTMPGGSSGPHGVSVVTGGG